MSDHLPLGGEWSVRPLRPNPRSTIVTADNQTRQPSNIDPDSAPPADLTADQPEAEQLQDPIERAQNERFKLLRLIKDGRGAAGQAAPAAASVTAAAANAPDQAGRMRTIDAWIARRLEEFRRAEARE